MPTFVVFTADFCGACQQFKKTSMPMAMEILRKTGMDVVHLNNMHELPKDQVPVQMPERIPSVAFYPEDSWKTRTRHVGYKYISILPVDEASVRRQLESWIQTVSKEEYKPRRMETPAPPNARLFHSTVLSTHQ